MKKRMTQGVGIALILGSLVGVGAVEAQGAVEQSVLGPGMYVYQTRTRHATCGDDERDGYVSSFVAPIHGVPGSRVMRMQLVNNPYFSTWTITVTAAGAVVGEARLDGAQGADAPAARFEVRADGDRFTGTGTRSYMANVSGRRQRCTVTFDALLRRIDL